jgi:hypothetical protein
LSLLPPYEAAAELFAYVAYPNAEDEVDRKRFQLSLSRWAITERAKIDPEWAHTGQVRPSIFGQSEAFFLKCWDDGTFLLAQRAICAISMVAPFLGGKAQLIDQELPPTVENISTRWVGKFLGYAAGSYKTVEADIWAPTKPVAHVAASLFQWLQALELVKEPWDEEHKLFNMTWCDHRWFLGNLFYSDIVKVLINNSEEMRHRMLKFNTFKRVKEAQTIQFTIA